MNNDQRSPLPPLPLSQAYSSSSSSPRLSSIGSSSASHAGSHSSYTSVASNGPKTPSPSLPINAITGPATTITTYDAMNHGAPHDMYYPPHMSGGQQPHHAPQPVTTGPMAHYPPQPPLLPPGQPYSNGAPSPYGQYGYANGMASPSGGQVPSSLPSQHPVLPLPGVGGQGAAVPTHYSFDTTGQQPPPGMKPRVTATLWEDEGSLCFQVEARGICVARREGSPDIFGFSSGAMTDSICRQPHDQWHKAAERCRHDARPTRWYFEE